MTMFDDLSEMLGGIVTRKVDAALFNWMRAVSGWLDEGSIFRDFNTLLPGDVSLPEWRFFDLANAPACLSNAGTSFGPVGCEPSAVWVNPGGVAVGITCHLAKPVGIPVGVTNVNLKIRASLPLTVVSSTLYLELRTAAGALVGSGTVALSPAMTTYTVLTDELVGSSTEYVVHCYLNQAPSSVNAQAIIEFISLEPSIYAPGSWRSDLYRVNIDQTWMQGGYDQFVRGRYWARQSFTATKFWTTSPTIYLEQYCWTGPTTTNACPITVNGVPNGQLFHSTGTNASPQWDFVPITLPTPGAIPTEVVIQSGICQGNNTLPNSLPGVFPTAIYFPRGFGFQKEKRDNLRDVFMFYADSIVAGIGVNTPEIAGVYQTLKKLFPYTLIGDCVGGRNLAFDVAGAGSVLELARRLFRERPKYFWFQVGVNDYGAALSGPGTGGTESAAAWQTQLTNLLIEARNQVPDIQCFVQGLLNSVTESNNSLGDNRAAFVAAAGAAVVAANAAFPNAYCTFLDVSGLIIPGAQTADGVHLNQFGQAIYDAYVITTLKAASIL